MNLAMLVSRAASAYPDDWILRYFDLERECAVDNPNGGDGLAEFIAWELYETFDPEAEDEAQMENAIGKLREAERDLHAVVTALENLKRERRVG